MSNIITRRALVSGLGLGGATLLSSCDRLSESQGFLKALSTAETGNFAIQRSLQGRMALAREFSAEDVSPIFKQNGSRMPVGDGYAAHVASKFADWRLGIDGLVSNPQSLSMAAVMAMPKRTQITRHDCVEGWSAIGKWTGVPLKLLLDAAGLKSSARYVVFHCADLMSNGAMYYESIDLVDAMHPQTMLAWALNDTILPIGNGAPLRLRVERQLGYKQAKYIQRVEAVASLDQVYGGNGGYWEDGAGYEWYGGL